MVDSHMSTAYKEFMDQADSRKKGLAIIYDPHNLYQFIWYFCNRGKSKEWDALCLPNGPKGEYMHPYCEATGIFSEIYTSETDFSAMETRKKCKMFLAMAFSFLTGRKKAYCRRLIRQFVDYEAYDEIVVIADVGFVSGACVALGQERNIVILEDGISDYGPRSRFLPKNKMASTYLWQGFLLARMGYCSPGWFRFHADEYCIKYCSKPEEMIYRGYKEIRQLFEEEGTDQKSFDEILKRTYPMVNNIDFESVEAVIFTRPLSDYTTDEQKYKKRLESYISGKYKSVLLKRHPREKDSYSFGEGVLVQELDNSVPAEAILPYLKGKDAIMASVSATLLYMQSYAIHCKVMIFQGLYQESMMTNSMFKPMSEDETLQFCEKYAKGAYQLELI